MISEAIFNHCAFKPTTELGHHLRKRDRNWNLQMFQIAGYYHNYHRKVCDGTFDAVNSHVWLDHATERFRDAYIL